MHLHVINSTNRISTACANQDNCRDIIAYAAAELRDAAEGRQVRPCPVLTALATVNPKKSAPGMSIYIQCIICVFLYMWIMWGVHQLMRAWALWFICLMFRSTYTVSLRRFFQMFSCFPCSLILSLKLRKMGCIKYFPTTVSTTLSRSPSKRKSH